jgi:hypothetical protein
VPACNDLSDMLALYQDGERLAAKADGVNDPVEKVEYKTDEEQMDAEKVNYKNEIIKLKVQVNDLEGQLVTYKEREAAAEDAEAEKWASDNVSSAKILPASKEFYKTQFLTLKRGDDKMFKAFTMDVEQRAKLLPEREKSAEVNHPEMDIELLMKDEHELMNAIERRMSMKSESFDVARKYFKDMFKNRR